MRYLVHLSFPYYTYHALILLNRAQDLINQGEEVELLLCGGGVRFCYGNILGDIRMCQICKKMQDLWPVMLNPRPKVFKYRDLIDSQMLKINDSLKFNYKGISEIKMLKYKNVQIGFGAYSTYVSKTRNIDPLLDKKFTSFFNELLKTECLVTDLLESYIERRNPNTIVSLNARHFEVKPFYDYPISNNIDTMCLEAGTSPGKDIFMGFDYQNNKPHSISYIDKLIQDAWGSADNTFKEKEKLGVDFFVKKRAQIATGGTVYTKNQKENLLPANWDKSKRNFVIFNSSEDEFVSIDEEWDNLAFFPNQMDGIFEIAKILSSQQNTWLYVRVHPALIEVNFKYHLRLYELERYFDNVTVIPADDEISSYALLDQAEKVIVFGSTIGVESVFWDKPVILLAGSYYYHLNICYIPQNVEQLKYYLEAVLPLKDKTNAIKYGYYTLTEKGFELDNLKLTRIRWLPFKPLKINKESYFNLFLRFLFMRIFSSKENKSLRVIPKLED